MVGRYLLRVREYRSSGGRVVTRGSVRLVLAGLLLITLSGFLPGTVAAGGVEAGLKARIGQLPKDADVDVLIFLAPPLDLGPLATMKKKDRRRELPSALRRHAAQTQEKLLAFLGSKKNRSCKSLWIVNAVAATVRAGDVGEIAGQPGVDRVALDGVVSAPVEKDSGGTATLAWNIDATHAHDLWMMGYDGTGVVVAVVDTGVDAAHADLSGRWRGGNNSWYDPSGEHATPYDHDGHGTMVTGIILGGDATGEAIGMAPGARWIGVKIFDDSGGAAYSDIHLGFQWLLDPDNDPQTDDAPQVVNNSWGLDTLINQCVTEFQSDIQILRASGIAVNFSAGNTGPAAATSISPANYPESFAVGGLDGAGNVAAFSGRGPSACSGTPYPALVAPAVDIRTTDLSFGGLFPENAAVVSGTSFAVPHVTGAMALLKSVSPWLSADELQQILTLSADDLGAPGVDGNSGNGALNVAQALDLLWRHTCVDKDGPFFSMECEPAPALPPLKGRDMVPILQLLLGD